MKKTIIFFTGIILLVGIITTINSYAQTSNKKTIFDYSKLVKLKEVFINDLKINSKPKDVLLTTFLEDYSNCVDEFNELLFEKYIRENINPSIDLRNELESNGLRLDENDESGYYISKNTKFLKSISKDLLDNLSLEFLNLYSDEIDESCFIGEGIGISKDKQVLRAYRWGDMLDKVSNTSYVKYCKERYDFYLHLIFDGPSNIAFDWETGKFNKEIYSSMQEISTKYPDSRASKDFQPYINILVEAKFTRTEKVTGFLNKKFPEE